VELKYYSEEYLSHIESFGEIAKILKNNNNDSERKQSFNDYQSHHHMMIMII